MLTEIQKKHDIEVEFDISDPVTDPDEGAKDILFRVTRELIINVVKHAHSSNVKVSISESDGCLKLRIADDGVGFQQDAIDKSARFGLFSVREQLENVGGRLEIDSVPGRGTTATVMLSLQGLTNK